jgi:hypothetical protein
MNEQNVQIAKPEELTEEHWDCVKFFACACESGLMHAPVHDAHDAVAW